MIQLAEATQIDAKGPSEESVFSQQHICACIARFFSESQLPFGALSSAFPSLSASMNIKKKANQAKPPTTTGFEDKLQVELMCPSYLHSLVDVNSSMRIGRQEDAQEFLSYILDGMHEELLSLGIYCSIPPFFSFYFIG